MKTLLKIILVLFTSTITLSCSSLMQAQKEWNDDRKSQISLSLMLKKLKKQDSIG